MGSGTISSDEGLGIMSALSTLCTSILLFSNWANCKCAVTNFSLICKLTNAQLVSFN